MNNNNELKELYIDSEMLKYLVTTYDIKFEVEKALLSDDCIKGKNIFGQYINPLFKSKKLQDSLRKKLMIKI